MDIIMPEMGGYEATTLIRKAEEHYKLLETEKHYICGFSADVNPNTQVKCKDCGMSNLLSKPMNQDILKNLLESTRRDSNVVHTMKQSASHTSTVVAA